MRRQDIPTARDVMVPKLTTFSPSTPVLAAIRTLVAQDISGAPVVDAEGRLLGHFSEHDCLRSLATSEYHQDGEEHLLAVSDLMTEMSHTIPPELDLYGIAHKFVTLRVRRLPVMDGDRLIGQVSRRDALRAVDALYRRRRDATEFPDYPPERRPVP